MSGYLTVVFKYEDFEQLQKDPLHARLYELFKVDDGPLRVTALSHDDEITRVRLLEEACERYIDEQILDAVETIRNTDDVNGFTFEAYERGEYNVSDQYAGDGPAGVGVSEMPASVLPLDGPMLPLWSADVDDHRSDATGQPGDAGPAGGLSK